MVSPHVGSNLIAVLQGDVSDFDLWQDKPNVTLVVIQVISITQAIGTRGLLEVLFANDLRP